MDGKGLRRSHILVSGLVVGSVSIASPAVSRQAVYASRVRIDVLFFDPENLVRERQALEDEVKRVLDQANVDVRFLRTSGPFEVSQGETPLSATLFNKEGPHFGLKDRVMGVAAATRSNQWNIFLFFPAILRTLAVDRALRDTKLGRVLQAQAVARVLVHEIVHFVAPREPHRKSGLMKSGLTKRWLTKREVALDRVSERVLLAGIERRNLMTLRPKDTTSPAARPRTSCPDAQQELPARKLSWRGGSFY